MDEGCFMKKIISLILAAASLLCISACSNSKTEPGEFEQSEIALAQNEIISGFGITAENNRIVAYENGIDYVKYIVAKYSDSVKTEEYTHYFCLSEGSFEKISNEFADDESAQIDSEKLYIRVKSNVASVFDYAKDKALIEKDYTIK